MPASPPPGKRFQLQSTLNGLTLIDTEQAFNALYIDFTNANMQYRQRTSGKRQPLAKAISIKGNLDLHVIDATAGLGNDAWILASLGCSVTMIEQSPLLYALLKDALDRACLNIKAQPIAQRITLLHGNSTELLQNINHPDVIYLDPMFPEAVKQAKTNEGMQILQTLIGHQDPTALFTTALNCVCQKVVVKRPQSTPILQPEQLNYQVNTKTGRFEVYWKANT